VGDAEARQDKTALESCVLELLQKSSMRVQRPQSVTLRRISSRQSVSTRGSSTFLTSQVPLEHLGSYTTLEQSDTKEAVSRSKRPAGKKRNFARLDSDHGTNVLLFTHVSVDRVYS
jgi:hypothetical protein